MFYLLFALVSVWFCYSSVSVRVWPLLLPVCLMVVSAVGSVGYACSLFLVFDTCYNQFCHPAVISTHAALAITVYVLDRYASQRFIFYMTHRRRFRLLWTLVVHADNPRKFPHSTCSKATPCKAPRPKLLAKTINP